MPKYFYVCNSCENKIILYHSMSETAEDCMNCNAEKSLKKLPSMFSLEAKKEESTRVGQLVEESIEEFKEDLKNQKNELKSEYSKNNE